MNYPTLASLPRLEGGVVHKGQEITWKENGIKRRAIVAGYPGEVYENPPKGMTDPVFVCTNRDFWLDLNKFKVNLYK